MIFLLREQSALAHMFGIRGRERLIYNLDGYVPQLEALISLKTVPINSPLLTHTPVSLHLFIVQVCRRCHHLVFASSLFSRRLVSYRVFVCDFLQGLL